MRIVPFPLSAAGRAMLIKLLAAGLLIVLLTLAVDAALITHVGLNSPTKGDGPYFIGLARSLASGHGYRLPRSFWPDQPDISRSPLWPVILSIPAALFPNADDNAILRLMGAALQAVSAALMLLLTFQLTGSFVGGILAGAFLGLYPPASALVAAGYSEIAFLVVILAGLILVFEGGKLAYCGVLLAGAGALARPNFVLLPAVLLVLSAVFRPRRLAQWRNLCLWVIGGAVFTLPAALWVARNYAVTGHFPVLSGMEGETLYGGNNERVSTDLGVWGYWIMPDQIPGEKTKRDLAQTRTEWELNLYYHDRAMQFIRANWYAVPRLMVGKLVRGFVPVPWVPLPASYIAFFFRACVYAAFVAFGFLWRERHEAYTLVVGAMFLVTLATTLVYYGNYRFTFCIEPFLFPFIVAGAANAWRTVRGLRAASHHRSEAGPRIC
jgi:hypothetical protein